MCGGVGGRAASSSRAQTSTWVFRNIYKVFSCPQYFKKDNMRPFLASSLFYYPFGFIHLENTYSFLVFKNRCMFYSGTRVSGLKG